MKATALLVMLTACTNSTGTLKIDLVTAPGSALLSSVERIRLTLTNPRAIFEAERDANGLDLAFEIDTVDDNGTVLIEGFDASGAPIIAGQSPPFPLAGSDASVAIYVAPPYSINEAPSRLLPARSQISATSVIFGAAFAGGIDEAGLPSAEMAIYNIYDHTFSYGEDMPVRRAAVTLAANDAAGVYVLGGIDDTATPTSTLHRFQTNIAPDGAYVDLGAHPGLESTGQQAIKLGPDAFFVTGPQPALIMASAITPIMSLASVPPAATAVTGSPTAAFVRDGIVGYYQLDGFIGEVALPSSDPDRAIAARPDAGTVAVIGGASRDAYVVTLASRSVILHANALSVPRRSPSVAATARHIVVVGGVDETGALIASADILDATTLDLIATVPIQPRTHTVVLALTNDQIMIVGGDDPTGLVELFTPPVPKDPAPP